MRNTMSNMYFLILLLFESDLRTYHIVAIEQEGSTPATRGGDVFINVVGDCKLDGSIVFRKVPVARTEVTVREGRVGRPMTVYDLAVPRGVCWSPQLSATASPCQRTFSEAGMVTFERV